MTRDWPVVSTVAGCFLLIITLACHVSASHGISKTKKTPPLMPSGAILLTTYWLPSHLLSYSYGQNPAEAIVIVN